MAAAEGGAGDVEEEEAQVAPSVAEGAELGFAGAGVIFDVALGDAEAQDGGLGDHFGGELHAGGHAAEAVVGILADGAEAALAVL